VRLCSFFGFFGKNGSVSWMMVVSLASTGDSHPKKKQIDNKVIQAVD
jgi:hypothetical protein